MAWLRERGRGAYADAYLAALEKIASHRGLADGKGIQTHIGFQTTEEGEIGIQSYIAPEAFHKARYTDGARRREFPETFGNN